MAQSSEIKLLKRFDQNVEITGTLTVGGVSVSPSSYLTSIPSEYLTSTEGNNAYAPKTAYNVYGSGYGWLMNDYDGSTNKLRMYYNDDDKTIRFYSYHGAAGDSHIGLYHSGAFVTFGGDNINNWNTAYGWGNHASAGYLTSLPSHSHNYIERVSTLNSGYNFNDLYANDQLRFHSTYAPSGNWVNGGITNYPTTPTASSVYGYGSTLSLKNNGQGMFQIYAPHQQGGNSDMFYRTGWNTSYTDWARMWTDRNHGSGSGLDADKLDGLHSSSFIRNNGYANQTEYSILDNGSLNGPAIKVRYDGSTANRYIDFGYKDGFGNYSSGLKLYNNSNLTWLGNTVITSANIGGQSVGYATNAGTLDGIDSGSFLRSDANDTMNGTLTMNSTLLMNNYNIEGVNLIKFNDPGSNEGLEWVGGSGWKIYESGNSLDNTSGNLQFVTGSTRRMTLNTSGILEVFGNTVEINGKYARDFAHSRYISGGGSLYGSGTSGWTKVAQITVTSNCSGAVLYGKMFSRAYHEAEIYNIAVVIRAECDFTSNNESHFIEFGCTTSASSENTDYRNRIRAVLVESSTNRRTYEVQFFETSWNDNWWELWSSGFTIYETPQTPGTATGTARINYRSRLSADDLYALNGAYAPTFYDRDNTSYYLDPHVSSNLAKLILNGTGIGNAATLKVNNSSSSTWNHSIEAFAANMTAGENNLIMTGKQGNDRNAGYMGFHWAANSSNNNFVGIGLWNYDNLFRVYPDQITGNSSFRAPIFYDLDNTAYYTDPASTSNVNVVNFAGYSSANGGFQVARNIGTTSPSWQDANHTLSLQNSDAGYLSINFHRAGYTSNNIYYTGTEIITDDTFRSTVDMRAPIFYDSNNTNYYIDPGSTTNLVNINMNNGTLSNVNHITIADPGANEGIQWLNGNGWHIYESTDSNNNGSGNLQFATNTTHRFRIDTNGNTFSLASSRAPIFYDYNNTGYYVDPASTSIMQKVLSYDGYKCNTEKGMIGDYDAAGTADKIIWTIGDSWNSLGNHYGIGYDYDTTYYHHLVFRNNGTAYSRIPFGSQAALFWGGIKAPVFYDSNDTSRYVDPSDTGTSIRVSGDIVAYYSDERLKDIEGNIPNALEKVKSLNGFYYTPNDKAQKLGYKKKREVGLSAQEVEAVLPELIKEAPISPEYKTLDYAKLVPVLVEAIKEQQKQIDELKKLINP
jgi:hypothetical protein